MQTVEVRLSTLAARHLAWVAALHVGEVVTVRITDPKATGLFTGVAPADAYLAICSYAGELWAGAGPFTAVSSGTPSAVTSWTATLDLRGAAILAAFAELAATARVAAWSGLLDTATSSIVGAGEVPVVGNPLAAGGGIVPTPTSPALTPENFADIAALQRPATITTLADQIAAILAALKGS